MTIKQISVFLENRQGYLAGITEALGNANINLVSLALADTNDFGIVRIIVNDVDAALKALRDAGFTATLSDVIAFAVDDSPGALAKALRAIADKGLDVEYMYVARTTAKAVIIFRFKEDTDAGLAALKASSSGDVLTASDVAGL